MTFFDRLLGNPTSIDEFAEKISNRGIGKVTIRWGVDRLGDDPFSYEECRIVPYVRLEARGGKSKYKKEVHDLSYISGVPGDVVDLSHWKYEHEYNLELNVVGHDEKTVEEEALRVGKKLKRAYGLKVFIDGTGYIEPDNPLLGIDFVELYKTHPEDFKLFFPEMSDERREKELRKIARLKERNDGIDEWLSEKYPKETERVARQEAMK